MKKGQILWTKEQLLLAINLYSKLPFGQINHRNPIIIDLAILIGRTPGAVAYKLVNFASLDPRLKQKGLSNASNLDKAIWQEYMENWDDVFIEGEKLLAAKRNTTIEKLYNINLDEYTEKEGLAVQRIVKVCLNQDIFRGLVLTNFDNKCCMTGIKIPELIVASHITPWSKDDKNRLNPQNGLALNYLHDKAFDKHLITLTEDYKIKISPKFYQHKEIDSIKQNFINYDGKDMIAPKKFYPDIKFLRIHNDRFSA
jgi:putative restriction endonuclease